jgi:ribosomal protein L11 methylase PrmA
VWQQASPDLSPEIEPSSFLSVDLLRHLADVLTLAPDRTLVDLGCGRGDPGLWLARSLGAVLVGADFSAVAVQQATERAARSARPRRTNGPGCNTNLCDATRCIRSTRLAGQQVLTRSG